MNLIYFHFTRAGPQLAHGDLVHCAGRDLVNPGPDGTSASSSCPRQVFRILHRAPTSNFDLGTS